MCIQFLCGRNIAIGLRKKRTMVPSAELRSKFFLKKNFDQTILLGPKKPSQKIKPAASYKAADCVICKNHLVNIFTSPDN